MVLYKTFAHLLFQRPSILKFSFAFSANNHPSKFNLVILMHTALIIATSERILNVVKNFVQKLFESSRKPFNWTHHSPEYGFAIRALVDPELSYKHGLRFHSRMKSTTERSERSNACVFLLTCFHHVILIISH